MQVPSESKRGAETPEIQFQMLRERDRNVTLVFVNLSQSRITRETHLVRVSYVGMVGRGLS